MLWVYTRYITRTRTLKCITEYYTSHVWNATYNFTLSVTIMTTISFIDIPDLLRNTMILHHVWCAAHILKKHGQYHAVMWLGCARVKNHKCNFRPPYPTYAELPTFKGNKHSAHTCLTNIVTMIGVCCHDSTLACADNKTWAIRMLLWCAWLA